MTAWQSCPMEEFNRLSYLVEPDSQRTWRGVREEEHIPREFTGMKRPCSLSRNRRRRLFLQCQLIMRGSCTAPAFNTNARARRREDHCLEKPANIDLAHVSAQCKEKSRISPTVVQGRNTSWGGHLPMPESAVANQSFRAHPAC